MAAGGLEEESGLNLYKAIDERSAAFLALGIATGTGKAPIVITTSGTAVANLLPAAVEADRSCQPIIFVTADRPHRLKGCGANQTVNQEEFLRPVCRGIFQGPSEGIHILSVNEVMSLVGKVWNKSFSNPGPVHFNIPIEEPLFPTHSEQKKVWNGIDSQVLKDNNFRKNLIELSKENEVVSFPDLDPFSFGIIHVGPWRGKPSDLEKFRNSLLVFHSLSNWPIFADPLSGLSSDQPGLVNHWELLISSQKLGFENDLQVLRLGPISASRALEEFLTKFSTNQVLITEGEHRPLDPLRIAKQYSYGFSSWVENFLDKHPNITKLENSISAQMLSNLSLKSQQVDVLLDDKLAFTDKLNQPLIIKFLDNLAPPDLPIMVSSSSLVRDLLTYSNSALLSRRIFSFRGASGIDGNISLAIGLSSVLGPMICLCGDLAFIYDSNALLLSQYLRHPLILLLIDNNGGGIFRNLNLDKLYKGTLEDLFIMPQKINISELASAYGVAYKEIKSLDDLGDAIEWGLRIIGLVVIRVRTDSEEDTFLRKNIAESLQEYIN